MTRKLLIIMTMLILSLPAFSVRYLINYGDNAGDTLTTDIYKSAWDTLNFTFIDDAGGVDPVKSSVALKMVANDIETLTVNPITIRSLSIVSDVSLIHVWLNDTTSTTSYKFHDALVINDVFRTVRKIIIQMIEPATGDTGHVDINCVDEGILK